MTAGSDKWIRSVKDNPAGKVVAEPEDNRWQWQSEDETAIQLKKLENAELAIERTDLHPALPPEQPKAAATAKSQQPVRPTARRRDAGGGFNPYDNPGKPRRG